MFSICKVCDWDGPGYHAPNCPELNKPGKTTAPEPATPAPPEPEGPVQQEVARLRGYIADCCGDREQMCESYGCSTLREIVANLEVAAPAPDTGALEALREMMSEPHYMGTTRPQPTATLVSTEWYERLRAAISERKEWNDGE